MAKIKAFIGLLFVAFAFASPAIASNIVPEPACSEFLEVVRMDGTEIAPSIDVIIKTYRAEIGVREATGHNDGPQVEKYLLYSNLGKGHAWCAAFVNYCFQVNGIATVSSPAWSPSWFNRAHLIYRRDYKLLRPPSTGDVFGIFFNSKKRIAHVGFIDEYWNNDSRFITTVEGNTNGAGSREGDGVYRKRRLKRQIYAVSSNFI